MAAPCSPAGPAITIWLIYMLQNPRFWHAGRSPSKRFGQNPRSRFLAVTKPSLQGGQLPKLDFAAYFNIGRRTARRKDGRVGPETNPITKVRFILALSIRACAV